MKLWSFDCEEGSSSILHIPCGQSPWTPKQIKSHTWSIFSRWFKYHSFMTHIIGAITHTYPHFPFVSWSSAIISAALPDPFTTIRGMFICFSVCSQPSNCWFNFSLIALASKAVGPPFKRIATIGTFSWSTSGHADKNCSNFNLQCNSPLNPSFLLSTNINREWFGSINWFFPSSRVIVPSSSYSAVYAFYNMNIILSDTNH